MIKRKYIGSVIALVFLLACVSTSGAAVVKWSQVPSMEPGNGYSFSSETQVPSQVADDFFCSDGLDVIGITWWGSYWDTSYQGESYYPYPNSDSWGDPAPNPPSGMITGFNINLYKDVPAGTGVSPWSHPGAQVYVAYIPMSGGQVTETEFGTITNQASEQTVFEYHAKLSEPFQQEAKTTYWLSIQAVDQGGNPLQWGWQESEDHWNDTNAVQIGFSPQGWWDLLPGEDMAFKLEAVPIPTSLLLFGSGLLGLVGIRRKVR